jgi:type IV secretory pathway TrbF-like protein
VVNRRPGWRRHLPALLHLLALAALILALARPQATVLASKQQATVMLVMDVSGSMNAIHVGFGSYEETAFDQQKRWSLHFGMQARRMHPREG